MRFLNLSLFAAAAFLALRCGSMEPDFVRPPDPVFAVTAPSTGDTISAGSLYAVRWLTDGNIGDNVRIELLNGTGSVLTIAATTPNNREYKWEPPFDIKAGNAYRVVITSVPDNGFSDTTGKFSIVNYNDEYEVDSLPALATVIGISAVPQLHTLPRGDVDWFRFDAIAGTTYCIQPKGASSLRLGLYGVQSNDSLTLLSSGIAYQGQGALLIWTCARGGTYYFSVFGNTSGTPGPYSVGIKAGNAICKLLTPAKDSSFAGGSAIAVTWVHSSNAGALASLYLYREDTLVRTLVSGTSNNGAYSWTVPYTLPSSGRYRVKLVSDNDLTVNDFSEYFTIDNVPWSITITAPGDSSSWNTGGSYRVLWAYSGDLGLYASLALYDGTTFVANLASTVDIKGCYFNWPISGQFQSASTYRLKLTVLADTSISATSRPFTITRVPTTVTITAPGADTNWIESTVRTISWTSTGDGGAYVLLELFEGDIVVDTIAAAASLAAGQFNWLVPVTLPTSPRYRVRVTSIADSSITDFSDRFTITHVIPQISVTAPGTASVWNVGSPCTINWNSSGPVGGNVSIGLYQDSALVWPMLPSVTNNGAYAVTLPSDLPGGNRYRIKVAGVASPAVYSFSDYFTIIPMPIRVKITSPTALSSWTTGSSCLVQWTSSGPGVSIVKIELFDSSAFVKTLSANEYASDEAYVWLVPFSLHTGGRYRIKITNTSIDSVFDVSDYFTVTNSPATIGVTAPSAGVSWKAGSTQSLTWTSSSNVPGTTIAISLYDDSSTQVAVIAANVNRAGGSYAWTVPATLPGNVSYRIKISSTIDPAVYTFSAKFTVLPQPNTLTVIAPSSAASWTAGGYYTIYWSSTGSPGTAIAIDLYDSSAFVQAISSKVYTTNGSFLWSVPSTLAADNRYRIKIRSTTLDTVFDFSDTFTIKRAAITDAYEPDSVPALAKTIARGAAAQNHVLTVGDQDWFSFIAVSGTTYTMETHGPTDTFLDLFSTNGTNLIASNDDAGSEGLNAKIAWTPATSGGYFFRVRGSAGSVGEYSVTVR